MDEKRAQAQFSGTVTAATSSTLVRPAYQGRGSIRIQNTGATDAYLALEPSTVREGTTPVAVVGSGICLKAAGGAGSSWFDSDYYGAVSAIAVTSATNLAVVEI